MTPPVSTLAPVAPLSQRVSGALRGNLLHLSDLARSQPVDRRDRFLSLLTIYDLQMAPLQQVGDAAKLSGHPAVADLKYRLEADWLAELELAWVEAGALAEAAEPEAVRKALRAVAARDRLPKAYRWLAAEATRPQLVEFLAREGGPDGGFDDLVAICQVGLSGSAKLELGKNYWDEMGGGDPAAVHTVLHERMAAALALPRIPRAEQSEAGLERAAFGGLLATNRWLQPEMLGALGLLELQAGPRCRLVLQAFDRLAVPAAAYPFYAEHAEVDPIHGRDWLDKAVLPVVAGQPDWGARIVKGAWWRSSVNLTFFSSLWEDIARSGLAT